MKKITVIGSANADMFIKTDKMPKIGETVNGRDFCINAGGKGLNQAVAISKLGGSVSFLGAVGNDKNGAFLTDTLLEYGIDFVGYKSEAPTGIAMVTVVNSDNFIILDHGANYTLTPEIIEEKKDIIAKSDYIVLQYEIPLETVMRILEKAREYGTKVILNPAPFAPLPKEYYSMIDYIIPNEHEAADITGTEISDDESAELAVKKIKALGVENVIITLGDKGCVYNDGDEIFFKPAESVIVVDTTSAGDSFIGGLTVALCGEKSLLEAVDFATRVSAITVSRDGAAKSIPYAHEL